MNAEALQGAIQRLIQRTASKVDLQSLREALASGAITIASGQRSVALGGDASGAVITTGDTHINLTGAALKLLRPKPTPRDAARPRRSPCPATCPPDRDCPSSATRSSPAAKTT